MPQGSKTFIAPNLGIDSSAPGTYIDPRATPRSKNIQVWRELVSKRRGGIAFGSAFANAERILALPNFIRDGAQYILRVGPTKVESWNSLAWADIAHAALTADDTYVVSIAYPVIGGKTVAAFTNFKDAIRYYDGGATDTDLAAGAPKAKFLLNYQGYLLAINTEESGTAFPERVRWPDAGDPTAWATGDAGAKDLLDDDRNTTGVAHFGQFAAVHKESAIYLGALTGTSTIFRFVRVEAPGTVAHNTIVNFPDGTQGFLSREGLRIFNGVNAPLIESRINQELRETMSAKYLYKSWALMVSSLDEAWFGIAIGDRTEPDTIFKYNYLTKQIYKDERPSATMANLFEKTDQASWDSDPEPWDSDTTTWDSLTDLALEKRVMVGYSNGATHERTDSANDAGTSIDAEWESKDYTAADFQFDDVEGIGLEWQGLDVQAVGSSVDVYYSLDEGLNYTFAQTLTLSSIWPTSAKPLVAYFRTFGDKCRFKLKNNAVGGSFSMRQIRPLIVPREGPR